MSNLTDFFPSGGGGLTPKFEEFNASGFFTPSQALIDAGGYIEIFLVAGGGRGQNADYGGSGGEAFFKNLYLTSVSSLMVAIGSGAAVGGNGGDSSVTGPTGSGVNLTALGGLGGYGSPQRSSTLNASWGSHAYSNTTAGPGVSGYGAGGTGNNTPNGIPYAKPNSGQGSSSSAISGSGYCLIKWYE